MRNQWLPGHLVGVYVQLDGHLPALVGTAKTGDDVPRLLRYIADEWQRRRYVEGTSGAYFAADDEPAIDSTG